MDDFDEDNDKLEPTSSSVTSRPIRSVDDNPHELLVKNTKKASTYRPITKNYPIFQRSQIQNDAPPPDEISDIVGYSYDGKPIYATGSHLWFESRKQAMKKILKGFGDTDFNDPKLRPGLGSENYYLNGKRISSKTTEVHTWIKVVGLGPVSDLREEFIVTMFFRMTWKDNRLKFNETYLSNREELRLNSNILSAIWCPDIFFRNSKEEYFHDNTQPNQLIRIRGDGSVMISSRLSIVAKCPMNFENFPFDVHICGLLFSSYQYTKEDLELIWRKSKGGSGTPAVIVPEKKAFAKTGHIGQRLLQFKLVKYTVANDTVMSPTGEYSTLVVCFQFERALIYYLLNTYFPCYLLVVLSQVSFWINKEATPARMTYGSMTVLALTQMSISERQTVPKVSYVTAYDFYITSCFIFCFAALIEFAVVNHFTIIAPKKVIDDVVTRRKSQRAELKKQLSSLETKNGRGAHPAQIAYSKFSAGNQTNGRSQEGHIQKNRHNDQNANRHNNSNNNNNNSNNNLNQKLIGKSNSDHNLVEMVLNDPEDGILDIDNPMQVQFMENNENAFLDMDRLMGDSPNGKKMKKLRWRESKKITNSKRRDSIIKYKMSGSSNNNRELTHEEQKELLAKFKQRERNREKDALIAMTTDSVVDKHSRIIFPVVFLVFNLCYWIIYIKRKDELLHQNLNCTAKIMNS